MPDTKQPEQPEQTAQENFIIRIAGKVFRCSCGCNVFQKRDPDFPEEYTCNSCGATYEGV